MSDSQICKCGHMLNSHEFPASCMHNYDCHCREFTPPAAPPKLATTRATAGELCEPIKALNPLFNSNSVPSKGEGLDLESVLAAVDAEPEFPGDPPEGMLATVRRDDDAAMYALRLAVRQTKEGISERIRQIWANLGDKRGSEASPIKAGEGK